MLAYLNGVIKERHQGEMILVTGADSQGQVGYLVKTPDHPRYEVFIPGQRAEVYLYTHVREDSLDLFGFQNTSEKLVFLTLLQVSGVGPKMALSLLSHADEAALVEMILQEDKAALTAISGVGKKTAERIVLELKDVLQKKIDSGLLRRGSTASGAARSGGASSKGGSADRANPIFIDAYLALQELGYKEAQAKQMVESAFQTLKRVDRVEEVLKQALKGGGGA
jgi:Holliday junction DNA helicase RuvA